MAEDQDGEGACSAGYLKDLASGKRFAIQLENAPVGTTCHLNAEGVDGACEALLPQIASADVIVLGKFGKLEAMGQGLRRAFVAATDAGKPVLTTVSSRHAEAWNDWAPTADWIEPSIASIDAWWQTIDRGRNLRASDPADASSELRARRL